MRKRPSYGDGFTEEKGWEEVLKTMAANGGFGRRFLP
jgi:hypothetical protein